MNWSTAQDCLLRESRRALASFFEVVPKEEVCAVGFVFEYWNAQPQFNLCANTRSQLRSLVEGSSGVDPIELRWCFGDYQFPAGLTAPGELGPAWAQIAFELHAAADDDDQADKILDATIELGCRVLADLALEGALGPHEAIDLVVAEVGDEIEDIVERNGRIRNLIEARPNHPLNWTP